MTTTITPADCLRPDGTWNGQLPTGWGVQDGGHFTTSRCDECRGTGTEEGGERDERVACCVCGGLGFVLFNDTQEYPLGADVTEDLLRGELVCCSECADILHPSYFRYEEYDLEGVTYTEMHDLCRECREIANDAAMREAGVAA